MGCETINVEVTSGPIIEISSNTCGGGSVDTSLFLTTGDAANLYYPRNDNISGYITSSAASGVTSLNTLAGVVSLTGRGGTVITLSGQYIQISGGSSSSDSAGITILSGNLYTTGHTLDDKTNTLSGYLNNFFVDRKNNQSITGTKIFTSYITTNGINTIAASGAIYLDLGQIYSPDNSIAIFYGNRELNDTSNNPVLDWGRKTLTGIWSTSGLKSYFISGINSTVGVDLQNGVIYVGGAPSIDFNSKQLFNNSNQESLSWNNHTLKDTAGVLSQNWTNRILYDTISNYSIQYADRFLRNSAQDYVLDWNNLILSGEWKTNSSGNNYYNLINYGRFSGLSGNVNTTGQNLYNIITGFSGIFNNSGAQYQSQLNTLTSNLGTTGSITWNTANNNGINLSGNLQNTGQTLYGYITNTSGNLDNRLYQTGVNLFALISASSAGVGSLNAQSGALVLTGAGNVTVIVNGQNFTISGYTGDYINFAQKTALENTGISLKASIDLISGNLITSGVNLGSKIDSLSGWVNNTSRVSSISVTGFSPAFTGQIGISGLGSVTIFTGINNSILISGSSISSSIDHGDGINISGNLTNTGITLLNITTNSGASLYNNLVGFSGVFNSTGVAVQTQFTNLSNNLQTTGQTLDNKINGWGVRQLNGLSGQLTVSGAGNITVQNSGNNTIFISGDISTLATINNLYSTGSTLDNKIVSLSGYTNTNLTNTGASLYNNISTLTTNLGITGSTLDGKINILSGYSNNNFATISSLNNYGVKSLNNISGTVFISGVNQIQVVQSGSNTLFISGVDIATATNLTNTGVTLINNIVGLSGVLSSDIANLQSTGSVLYNDIIGLSGVGNTTITNLQTTGSTLNNRIISLSGDLASTGSNLQSQINTLNNLPKVTGISVTGYNSLTGAIGISGLGTITIFTGINNSILISGSSIGISADHGDGVNLSGNLTSTGITLYNQTNSLSGYLNNQFVDKLTNQNITGIKTFISNYIFQSGSGVNLFINSNPVLTGVVAGSNITVNNNSNGSFTINASAGGGGGGGVGITGFSITGSTYTSGTNGKFNISGLGVSVILSGENNILITGDFYPMRSNPSGYVMNGGVQYTTGVLSGIGYLFFDDNMGRVAAFDANITGGNIPSGTVNSYSFNINAIPVATIYSEYFSGISGGGLASTGIQNVSFNVNKGLNFAISGVTSSPFIFGDTPYYVNTNITATTGRLPSLLLSSGRIYHIKNRAGSLLITGGLATDLIFTTSAVPSLTINSGEAYMIIAGGTYWDVL